MVLKSGLVICPKLYAPHPYISGTKRLFQTYLLHFISFLFQRLAYLAFGTPFCLSLYYYKWFS